MDKNETYYVAIHYKGDDPWSARSEDIPLTDAGVGVTLDHIKNCVAGREILSFNNDKGNIVVVPHAILSRCVVVLVGVLEEEDGD